jgi:PAS domain S-box-containing protein
VISDDSLDELARLRASEEQLRVENEQLVESQRLTEEARDAYADLYDRAPLALLTLDAVGSIQQLNLTAAALFGEAERRLIIGKRLKTLIVEDDHGRLADHLRACSSSESAVTCELRLKVGNGSSVPAKLWSRRSPTQPRLYPTAIIDLSQQGDSSRELNRLMEAERSARAASDAKDQFIAILSHELRTPLTPVLAAVSALTERDDVPAPLKAMCEMIRRNVLTETRLIDDLLDVTHIARGKLSLERVPVDVHGAVRQALELLSSEVEAKRLSVVTELEANRHWADADPVRLRQVFWNILRNAVKFTDEGGRIEIRSWNNNEQLAVEIGDSGIGFNPDAAAQLFEPFEQDPDVARRHGGLGLGLAICRGIVDSHGGRITASSRGVNLGARFVVEIESFVENPAGLALATGESKRPIAERQRILLVEDDPDTAAMLREILYDAGHEVRTASTAQAALAEELDAIDLVVSDIGLPDYSGLELMRRLRGKRDIKGIALSGYGTEADKRASREAGFSAHLTKPIEIKGLLDTIDIVATSF